MVQRPSIERLPAELARAARDAAEVLGRAGWRAYLVGGAVRDLALGVEPHDADLASAARPAEVERLFPRSHAVGKAFGTVVVRCAGLDLQVTTFRSEGAYPDARRPATVSFATSPEEDARRRDFTCNALYLDPLSDELFDPTGGLADLGRGLLRCVGEPRARFAEDGLRLLRLARLAAAHGLEVEEHTAAGARSALEALRGVSPERVLEEVRRMAGGPAPARAFALLSELGVLARVPGLAGLDPRALAEGVAALARLQGGGEVRVLATLLWTEEDADERAGEVLRALRAARALQDRVRATLEVARELGACLAQLADVRRARWVRLARAEELEDAWAAWRARHPGRLEAEEARLRERITALSPAELRPAPLVTSEELAASGIPRGPRWSELLRAAEDLQLDGELRTREEARAWLARRARE